MKFSRKPILSGVSLLLASLIWLTGALGVSRADDLSSDATDGRLWIILSNDNPFFKRSIHRLEALLTDRLTHLEQIDVKEVDTYRKQLSDADLIITLGARAMRQVGALALDRPLLHAYLTRYQFITDPPVIGSHSLLLDQPLPRMIRFDRMVSGGKRIGLLSSEASAYDEAELSKLSEQEQVELVQQLLPADFANPVATVRELLRDTDNLLALPAPDIYNRNTLKGILLAAYRLRKPVISYSPSHVRAGALGALYTTPEQIGDQLANLTRRWLDGEPPKKRYSLAQFFAIELNTRVASSLGIELPDLDELHQAIEDAMP